MSQIVSTIVSYMSYICIVYRTHIICIYIYVHNYIYILYIYIYMYLLIYGLKLLVDLNHCMFVLSIPTSLEPSFLGSYSANGTISSMTSFGIQPTLHTRSSGHLQTWEISVNIWRVLDNWLVVEKTPLKNMSLSIGMMIIPNIWENKKCSKAPTRLWYSSRVWIIYAMISNDIPFMPLMGI